MISRKRRLAGFIRNLFGPSAQNEEVFSESIRNFASTQSLREDVATLKPGVGRSTKKVRARKNQLLSIVHALGNGRAETRLEFRINGAVTSDDLSVIRTDLYSLLAKERGEAYAQRVLAGQECAVPRMLAAPNPVDAPVQELKESSQ